MVKVKVSSKFVIAATLILSVAGCTNGVSSKASTSDPSVAKKVAVTSSLFKRAMQKELCDTKMRFKIDEVIKDFTGDGVADGVAFYGCVASAGRSAQHSYFAVGDFGAPSLYDSPFNSQQSGYDKIRVLDKNSVKIYFQTWSSMAPDCCSDGTGTAVVKFINDQPFVTKRTQTWSTDW